MGKSDKPKAFERLSWGSEAVSPSQSATSDPDSESIAALMALGGFQCSKCRQLLSQAKGYICCHTAHCPFCGVPTTTSSYSSDGCCDHLIYRNTDNYWSFEQVFRRGKQSDAEQKRWEILMQPTPPGRRLPGQKGWGYSHWTDEQKAEAYPAPFHQYLSTIFTPPLRTFSAKRLHPVLLPYIRPEIKTHMRDIHGHRHDHYFSADTTPAVERVAEFMTQLEAGTQKLRTMPSEKIIRPQATKD